MICCTRINLQPNLDALALIFCRILEKHCGFLPSPGPHVGSWHRKVMLVGQDALFGLVDALVASTQGKVFVRPVVILLFTRTAV